MTVTRLALDDLDWLVNLAREFNDKIYDVPLNLDKTEDRLFHMIRDGVGFRSPRGAIIGQVMEDPFRDYTLLMEQGWYSTGTGGLDLLTTFIQQGREVECVDEVRMSTLETTKRAETLLKRQGFKPIERQWGLRFY